MKIKIPQPHLEKVTDLKPNRTNVKVHSQKQIEGICELIKMVGFKDPLVIDAEKTIWAGHGRFDAALMLGMEEVPCVYAEDMTAEQLKAFMLMDNRISELSDWNRQNVQIILDEIPKFDFKPFHVNFTDFKPLSITSGFSSTLAELKDTESPEKSLGKVSKGDIWQLGNHRIMCGDATLDKDRSALLEGKDEIDLVVTDPPYSSGGFQEAGKYVGSIGSTRIDEKTGKEYNPKIAMDDLSTRGYIKLIRGALAGYFAHGVYLFTDWRMWDWTREAIELAGYQVRSMIVWDKQTPGMGIQWRGQHELIAYGKTKQTVTPEWGKGNVLSFQRSGNKHHPTEKPVKLLQVLIENNKRRDTVYDPFAGSGSTLITAEQLGKKAYCMELDVSFCDIMIQRWEKLTGEKAERL